MEVILALAILLAIWVLVIWGSIYFNKNVVAFTGGLEIERAAGRGQTGGGEWTTE